MKKSTKNIKPRILTDRECEVIGFLWKWKVATIITLREAIAPKTNFWNFYHSIRQLEKDGYIEVKKGGMIKDKKFSLWHLTAIGFDYQREFLSNLEDTNFASTSPFHDSYVTAFHFGYWLYNQPSNVELFTEQEMKCHFKSNYPDWMPASKVHRPDGYTKIKVNQRNKIYAIEVEYNLKDTPRYEAIGDFYADRKSIDFIVWLVKDDKMLDIIWNCISKRNGNRIADHQFILLEDFEKYGWDAKIQKGSKAGETIHQLYSEPLGNQYANRWGTASCFTIPEVFFKPIQSPRGLST